MNQPRVVGDRYELVREIGAGGMGQVFEGFDRNLERRIAVKLTAPGLGNDPGWTRRFLREARVMAQISHPGMPAIHDAGIAEGEPERPYLVMEYIQGVTFDNLLIRHGPLPLGVVAALGAQVAAVLTATHRNRIYHRDLKPSNLMLCADGTVKVLDFGLAVILDEDRSRFTTTGNTLGTPAFMAPEQIEGKTVRAQTDLYALGLVLYELLTGDRVMTGDSPYLVWQNQIHYTPREIRRDRDDVPVDMGRVIMSMIAKSPERRPEDAAIVHSVLVRYAAGLGSLPELADAQGPVRMYAEAVGTAVSESAEVRAEPAKTTPQDDIPTHVPEFSRSDLRRAVRRARDLAVESRYTPAIAQLNTVVEAAVPQLGVRDADVVDARLELAGLRFDANDFTAAAEVYRSLVEDLTDERGPYDEQVMYCQRRLAACDAETGDQSAALSRLRRLHAQMAVRYGEQDRRVVDLARHIERLT